MRAWLDPLQKVAMETVFIFLATGVVSGLLAGLFGVGGGLIIVPALAFVLPTQQVPADVYMHVAIGTSLAVIAATSMSSAHAHHRRGGVDWRTLARFAPGLIAGAILGALFADTLSSVALKRIVGVGALLVSLQMVLRRKPTAHPTGGLRAGSTELVAAGCVVGALSSLVGIGGGSLSVPYLSLRGLSLHRAVGTSAASGIPIAWAGMSGFIFAGWHAQGVPAPHLGYVSLLAFATIAAASVSCAPLGARLAHAIAPHLLRAGFALLLFVVGSRMLLS